MEIDKNGVDCAGIFLTYMLVIGDVAKTAATHNLDPEFVSALALQEGWNEKVRRVSLMSKSGRPGDWERAQNRCLNFIQASRIRRLIDRILIFVGEKSDEDVIEDMRSESKLGKSALSARFLLDLTTASEKAQMLSYAALSDTIAERADNTDSDETAPAKLHAALIAALNNPSMQGKEAELLLADTQVEEAKIIPTTEQI